MMFPSIFGENVFDDWNDDAYGLMNPSAFFGKGNPLYGKHAGNIMKTDIRETDKTYEMDVDLPGFSKENIQVQLEKGYLTIVASKALDKDEKDRQVSASGTVQRNLQPQLLRRRSPHQRGDQGEIRRRRAETEHPQEGRQGNRPEQVHRH